MLFVAYPGRGVVDSLHPLDPCRLRPRRTRTLRLTMPNSTPDRGVAVTRVALGSHSLDMLKLDVIRDEAGFSKLLPEWNAIAEQMRRPSLFLRHEWFQAAWQWRRLEGCELRVLAIRRQGRLLGALPLIARSTVGRSWRPLSLETLAVPDTQQTDILTGEEDAPAVAGAIAGWLGAHAGEWKIVSIAPLVPGSQACESLYRALTLDSIPFSVTDQGASYYIDLVGRWKDYYATRSRRLRKGNNLVANKLHRAGRVQVDWITDPRDAPAALEAVTALSARSWKSTTGLTLDRPGPRAFIRHLTGLAAQHGWLSIWLLKLDGRPIAAEYQLIANDQVHALRADYDPAYKALSPGTYLNWKLLEGLFASDLRRYHLGPGSNAYKLRWTRAAEPSSRLIAYSPSLSGRLLYLRDARLRPIARSLKHWLSDRSLRGSSDAGAVAGSRQNGADAANRR